MQQAKKDPAFQSLDSQKNEDGLEKKGQVKTSQRRSNPRMASNV